MNHIGLFFDENEIKHRKVTSREIMDGALANPNVAGIVMPGGESWTYLDTLGKEGGAKIKKFVENGGHYFGLCAGAFYATSLRVGGFTTGEYGIGLLDGVAYDGEALNIPMFKDGMKTIFTDIPSIANPLRVIFLQGPAFAFTAKEREKKKIRVLARFDDDETNRPAMLLFHYGKGMVFLSGPHPEIEEELLGWTGDYADPDSEWPLLKWVIEQMKSL